MKHYKIPPSPSSSSHSPPIQAAALTPEQQIEQEIEDLQVQHLLRVYKPEVWDVMREDIRARLRGENLKGKTGKK